MRPECIACMDDENYRERSKHCLKKILRTLRAHSLYHYCCSNIYNGDKVKMITRAAAAVTTSSTHYSSIRFLIGNSLTTKKSVPLNNTASKGLGSRGITTCTSSSRDSLMLRRRALNCQGGFIHNQAPLTEVSTASTTKLRCTTFVTRRSFSSSSSDSNPLTASKQRILKDHNYCVDLVRDRDREGYCKSLHSKI